MLHLIDEGVGRWTEWLLGQQQADGSWRFCFDNGQSTNAYMIILLRSLKLDREPLIRELHAAIAAAQQADGSWKLYADERDGNLSATVEAYYALLYSGYSRASDEPLRRARTFIVEHGGIRSVTGVLTKVMLAATGQYPWPVRPLIPLEFLLLPDSGPISFFDFSGYARIHFAPILLLLHRRFTVTTAASPDLSGLLGAAPPARAPVERAADRGLASLLQEIHAGIRRMAGLPAQLRKQAAGRAEAYMLRRIEPDGTLYSYASCTFLMIYALLARGYDQRHPVIPRAVQGLSAMGCRQEGGLLLLQNSPSTVWDTALISHTLQDAGVPAGSPAIRRASAYLLARQHRKVGDWGLHVNRPVPGGWGFSDSNTINPDVDDTTAALRALHRTAGSDPVYRQAAEQGLNWILSMQNKDGGWPAFERGTGKEWLTRLPIEGAKWAATDPSTADLAGRTLEYLGRAEGMTIRQAFVRRGVDWLVDHQERDGSWYGRWGICYLYGTWAALTGMMAAGVAAEHPAVQKAVRWLLAVQLEDGGWGESCRSDLAGGYLPLEVSTPSQTAWALDALVAVHPEPLPEMERGMARLIRLLRTDGAMHAYPTGAGLPGAFYTNYHSYRYIWPLQALSHYRRKYGG